MRAAGIRSKQVPQRHLKVHSGQSEPDVQHAITRENLLVSHVLLIEHRHNRYNLRDGQLKRLVL